MFKLPPRRGTNRWGAHAERYRAEHPDRGFRETAAMQQVRHPECACDPPTDGQVQEGILNVRPLHRQSDLGRARRPISADDGYTAAQSAAALQRLCGLRKMGMPGDAGILVLQLNIAVTTSRNATAPTIAVPARATATRYFCDAACLLRVL